MRLLRYIVTVILNHNRRKEHDGVPLEDFTRSWLASVMGGLRAKTLPKVSRVPSPVGILELNFDELNFDGSFIKSLS